MTTYKVFLSFKVDADTLEELEQEISDIESQVLATEEATYEVLWE